jgi:3-oxoadipate enol-lactonase
MPTIQVNDIHMYYEIHGKGEPLVLIAGLGTDLSEYNRILRWFSKKYKVIAFDNRGVGRTDKPDKPYSIDMMAEDTEGLLNALGIEQVNVLGISMGGRIALALALQHPKRIKRLVLVSTTAGRRNNWARWRVYVASILASLPLFRSKYPQPYYAFVRQRQASFEYDCVDRLHELQIPTIILHGKKDRIAPYELAEEMHVGIGGSKMVPFKGGHIFFFLRERQQFLDTVATFLS